MNTPTIDTTLPPTHADHGYPLTWPRGAVVRNLHGDEYRIEEVDLVDTRWPYRLALHTEAEGHGAWSRSAQQLELVRLPGAHAESIQPEPEAVPVPTDNLQALVQERDRLRQELAEANEKVTYFVNNTVPILLKHAKRNDINPCSHGLRTFAEDLGVDANPEPIEQKLALAILLDLTVTRQTDEAMHSAHARAQRVAVEAVRQALREAPGIERTWDNAEGWARCAWPSSMDQAVNEPDEDDED